MQNGHLVNVMCVMTRRISFGMIFTSKSKIPDIVVASRRDT